MDFFQILHEIWSSIESNFLVRIILEATIAETALISFAKLAKFTKLDSAQRTNIHTLKNIAWHAIHLSNIIVFIFFWGILVSGFLLFAKNFVAAVVSIFLIVFFFFYVAQAVEDYRSRI